MCVTYMAHLALQFQVKGLGSRLSIRWTHGAVTHIARAHMLALPDVLPWPLLQCPYTPAKEVGVINLPYRVLQVGFQLQNANADNR